jgi:SAM-dependent methyltransferase
MTRDFKEGAIRYTEKLAPLERQHLYTKPFCLKAYDDCAARLHDFAYIITVLELAAPRRILDVGCGPGWLSEFLARNGHEVTGIDVSPGMIEIAQARISSVKFAPDGKGLKASFMVEDAETLRLEDRFHVAILYDSLHHFEDKKTVLANVFRVLKAGGRILIHEGEKPPEGSCQHRELQEIMEKYDTLEDPLEQSEIMRLLEQVGFIEAQAYVTVTGLFAKESFKPRQLARLLKEGPALNLIVARKERDVITSDDPNVLLAKIDVLSAQTTFSPKEMVTIQVRAKNCGDTIWLAEPNDCGGFVALGGRVVDHSGQMVIDAVPWAVLPREVGPGDSVDLTVQFEVPSCPGTYTLILDLVDEYFAWFEDVGSEVARFEFEVRKQEREVP